MQQEVQGCVKDSEQRVGEDRVKIEKFNKCHKCDGVENEAESADGQISRQAGVNPDRSASECESPRCDIGIYINGNEYDDKGKEVVLVQNINGQI